MGRRGHLDLDRLSSVYRRLRQSPGARASLFARLSGGKRPRGGASYRTLPFPRLRLRLPLQSLFSLARSLPNLQCWSTVTDTSPLVASVSIRLLLDDPALPLCDAHVPPPPARCANSHSQPCHTYTLKPPHAARAARSRGIRGLAGTCMGDGFGNSCCPSSLSVRARIQVQVQVQAQAQTCSCPTPVSVPCPCLEVSLMRIRPLVRDKHTPHDSQQTNPDTQTHTIIISSRSSPACRPSKTRPASTAPHRPRRRRPSRPARPARPLRRRTAAPRGPAWPA